MFQINLNTVILKSSSLRDILDTLQNPETPFIPGKYALTENDMPILEINIVSDTEFYIDLF